MLHRTDVSRGAFVPLAAAPMVIVLLVAIITVHLPNGFSSINMKSPGTSRHMAASVLEL
jgi:uncharacterized membrane protein YphA (DoxX/SURF4 family)